MIASRQDARNEAQALRALLARNSTLTQKEEHKKTPLIQFCSEVMPTYTWGVPWQKYWVEQEKQHDHLIFSVPPQHGKSTFTTVGYIANELENDPTLRVILGCYNHQLATSFARKIRRILIDRGVALRSDRKAAHEFELQEGGFLLAAGLLSGVTGKPCDLLVLDDFVKNKSEAKSETMQKRTFEAFCNDYYSRLNKKGRMRITGTRWDEGDLIGMILSDPELSKLFSVYINLRFQIISRIEYPNLKNV